MVKPYGPEEENPMFGFRGASRYIAHTFEECFEMECMLGMAIAAANNAGK